MPLKKTYRGWYAIKKTYRGWYAIKPNQPTNQIQILDKVVLLYANDLGERYESISSLHLGVNSRADLVLKSWFGNYSIRKTQIQIGFTLVKNDFVSHPTCSGGVA